MAKALFWDFDGTLIYPNESFLVAMQIALKNYKYEISVEETRKFLHTVCSWYTPEISYSKETGPRWWNNLFKQFESFYENNKIAKSDREKVNEYFKIQILDFQNYVLYADTEAVLNKCKEMGYRNYILSNNFSELPLVIKDLELSGYFTDYIVSSNIGYEKPRAEIFQYALHVADFPDTFYMIGDNPIADIRGGKTVGMKTISVHNKSISDADYICEHLSEIPVLLQKSNDYMGT